MTNEIRNEIKKDDILLGEGLSTSDLASAGDPKARGIDVETRGQEAPTQSEPRVGTGNPATGTVAGTAAAEGGAVGAATGAATAPAKVAEEHGPLFSSEEADHLRSHWDAVQSAFVDEPRKAVEDADHLVAAAMKRLAEMFAEERQKLEHQWDRGDNVSTEDLRIVLRRYRSFFSRLLSV